MRALPSHPGLAYMLFVSAIESLAQLAMSPADFLDWSRYDSTKRSLIDPALAGLDPEAAERIRGAILRGDQLSLGRRFEQFTKDHIEPTFFRSEAEEDVPVPVYPARASENPADAALASLSSST